MHTRTNTFHQFNNPLQDVNKISQEHITHIKIQNYKAPYHHALRATAFPLQ